ncbi:MAG: hypothetical protein LBU62_00785 [Bacteroidales bacterium]|jgi:hypothetical protein|nr:hypothetical protein [Bacteroidales bacterium]
MKGVTIMRPAFSNALYYPSIDIQNANWLKTAVLFWDSISTIVPESIREPYQGYDTQYLADIGFLHPIVVNPENRSVMAIEDDILELMFSPEFYQAICTPRQNGYSRIYESKMSYGVKENLKKILGNRIYADKLSWELREQLHEFGHRFNAEGVYHLDSEFAYMYMVALANKLCEDHSLGMVTDEIPCFDIGNTVRFGNQTGIVPEDRFRNRRPREHQFEQGLLLNFIISGLSISPDAELSDVVSFKDHHDAELGRFRTQLAKLTQGFSADKPIDVLQTEIGDLYRNEFVPAFEDLKAALKGVRIKWLADNFLKVSMMSAGATAVPMALLGMPVEQAIFAGAGVSVISSAISYSVDKKKALRENPYSYLLSIKQEW